jgi:hypothetical protein
MGGRLSWGAHSTAGEGLGESQFDEGTYTVVLFIQICLLCDYVAGITEREDEGNGRHYSLGICR